MFPPGTFFALLGTMHITKHILKDIYPMENTPKTVAELPFGLSPITDGEQMRQMLAEIGKESLLPAVGCLFVGDIGGELGMFTTEKLVPRPWDSIRQIWPAKGGE